VNQALSSFDGRYDRVLGETGIYVPDLPDVYNTLKEVHFGQAYYLRSTDGAVANLVVEGMPRAADTPLPLHAGWNWIGYLPTTALPVTQALASIAGQYQRVLSLDKTYDPALPEFSTLQELQPGAGYLIYANAPVTLTYPTSGLPALLTAPPESEQGPEARGSAACAGVQPTPYATLVYGTLTLNGIPAHPGLQVEVVTPRGEVAGCFVVERAGQYGLMHVYGADDTARPPIAGFRAGEPLAFRVSGSPAKASTSLAWQDDKTPHNISLEVTGSRMYLPLIRRE